MFRRLLTAPAALAALAVLSTPAAAAPPTVERVLRQVPVAPVLTAACGFTISGVFDIRIRTFSSTDGRSPAQGMEIIHVRATVTGPTGRSVTVTTNNHIMLREAADGSLVEVQTGRVLFAQGRRIVDPATQETLALSGRELDETSYCSALAA